MDKKVLTLAGVIAVVSVGTYVVLTLIKPHKPVEVKVADVYSADQIFEGTLDPNAPDEAAVSGAEPSAPSAPAESDPAEAAAAIAEPAAPANADAMATPIESDGAAPAAAAEPAHEQVAAAEPALAEPVAPPAPVVAEPAPAAVEEAAPAPKPVKKQAAPKKIRAASTSSSSSAPTPKAWWPAENPNQLSLVYAGSASFKKAIVLMFNGAFFKPDSPNANLKVTDGKGEVVSGSWELGENNRRMLLFPVPATGSYTVSVGSDLTDSKDRKLGSTLSGTVVIN